MFDVPFYFPVNNVLDKHVESYYMANMCINAVLMHIASRVQVANEYNRSMSAIDLSIYSSILFSWSPYGTPIPFNRLHRFLVDVVRVVPEVYEIRSETEMFDMNPPRFIRLNTPEEEDTETETESVDMISPRIIRSPTPEEEDSEPEELPYYPMRSFSSNPRPRVQPLTQYELDHYHGSDYESETEYMMSYTS